MSCVPRHQLCWGWLLRADLCAGLLGRDLSAWSVHPCVYAGVLGSSWGPHVGACRSAQLVGMLHLAQPLGLAHLPQLLDWELCRLLEMGSVQGCAMENTRIIEPLRLGKKTSQIPKSSPTMPTAHTSSASSPWFFGCSPTSPASCATGLCGCTTLARLCQALVSFLLQGQGRWLGMDREQSCCPWRH